MVENRVIKVRFIGAGAKPVDFDAVDQTVEYAGQPVVVVRK
jgi:alpha-D-xyloside xylohydrolase